MKFDQSDRLALLALIVSLVALIVSAWQLAQQLFATATDGKRFCQASVMGVWSRKTRLSWRWSQIRFETKYTTPEIRLSSGVPDDEMRNSEQATTTTGLFYRLPVIGWLLRVIIRPISDWVGFFEITTDRTDVPRELDETRQPGPKDLAKSDGSYRTGSPDVVSWPKLLEKMYDNQVDSVKKLPQRQPNGLATDHKAAENGEVHKELPCADMSSAERQQKEDRVIVRLVERSWDLVPPDVVRSVHRASPFEVIA